MKRSKIVNGMIVLDEWKFWLLIECLEVVKLMMEILNGYEDKFVFVSLLR